ncbi:hypothetical protein [Escherichia coli]|uniref:hypothetical protein n=1 Tax=Escherichia coli TaxID=562 RepID=UPI00092D75D9|nr:hypothetical protein [Escherichia coli]HBY2135014.1 hypothetical protein [Klebsiella pneumoniae]SQU10031.1 Uncharacterised protein [Escherichia coli]SQW48999.1 Uncharacterised protein [Escherichia coli]SQX06320.1 Uncharacterised protein [Escherichia coli]SQX53570.1 Uncharacterised protein [Escherichia coli]
MDTLTAGYQFSADAFRRFIIRTLTDDIPPDGDEKEIARFILRHPAFNGGGCSFWLQKFMKDPVPITASPSQ